MNIAVFGLGYVGSVTSACLAQVGHHVIGVDRDPHKLTLLGRGIPPIAEPGLASLLSDILPSGRLRFTDSALEAVHACDASLVCVGTPTSPSGGADLTYVRKVCEEIVAALATRGAEATRHTVVIRSTIPPGSSRRDLLPLFDPLPVRPGLCFNPEFLREGTALKDYFDAPFTVIGLPSPADEDVVAVIRKVYADVRAEVITVPLEEAELLKLACNAFHALKVTFANEVGVLATSFGANPGRLMDVFCRDSKLNISPAYLRPGFAFGGSCLPKDLRALEHAADQSNMELPLLSSVLRSNQEHVERIVRRTLSRDIRCVGIAGLTFKPDTDDVRESAALTLARRLVEEGLNVLIHEPGLEPSAMFGGNLEHALKELPDFGRRLVSWEEIRSRADVCLVTRGSIVSTDMAAGFHGPLEWLQRMEMRPGV